MLDLEFCIALEYKICEAFAHSADEQTRDFWCDGVLLSEPDIYDTQKYVNDKRQILLLAYIGKEGQTAYSLTLKLGPKSLSRYARGLSIIDCIPPVDDLTWFHIDTVKQTIDIHLL